MNNFKFDGPKYSTNTIVHELPLELQLYLWQLVDERAQTSTADYLQVFSLSAGRTSDGKEALVVKHSQVQPSIEDTYFLEAMPHRKAKIYVIDDISHVTMLFSHEY